MNYLPQRVQGRKGLSWPGGGHLPLADPSVKAFFQECHILGTSRPPCVYLLFGIWKYPQVVCPTSLVTERKKTTQKQRLGNETYHFSLNTRYKLLIHISEWFCFIYVIAGRTCRGPLLFGVLKWLDFFLFIQNMIIDFFWQCLIWKVINLHAVGPFNH